MLTGACLDVAGYDGAQGANVDVFRCERLDDQRWTLAPRGGADTFELRNVKRGLCLDVKGKAGGRGDDVMLWACDGGQDQLWRWEPYVMAPQRPAYPPQRAPVPTPPGRRVPPSTPPELQVPPPPPPPPRMRERRPRAMDDEPFRGLVAAVRGEHFAEGQLNVIRQAATRNFFTVGQVKSLIELLSFSATKLGALGRDGAAHRRSRERLLDLRSVHVERRQGTCQADPAAQRDVEAGVALVHRRSSFVRNEVLFQAETYRLTGLATVPPLIGGDR